MYIFFLDSYLTVALWDQSDSGIVNYNYHIENADFKYKYPKYGFKSYLNAWIKNYKNSIFL